MNFYERDGRDAVEEEEGQHSANRGWWHYLMLDVIISNLR
jgi:hypothetical protein